MPNLFGLPVRRQKIVRLALPPVGRSLRGVSGFLVHSAVFLISLNQGAGYAFSTTALTILQPCRTPGARDIADLATSCTRRKSVWSTVVRAYSERCLQPTSAALLKSSSHSAWLVLSPVHRQRRPIPVFHYLSRARLFFRLTRQGSLSCCCGESLMVRNTAGDCDHRRKAQGQTCLSSLAEAQPLVQDGEGKKGCPNSPSPQFIDVGANLTDEMYSGVYFETQKHPEDLDNVLRRATDSGVVQTIITGGSVADSKAAIELCRKRDPEGGTLFCTVGVHPTRCQEFAEDEKRTMEALKTLVEENRDRVAAIGEIGLDYDRLHFCNKETQIRYFEAQLSLVEHFQLPLFLHMRGACDDFCDVLSKFSSQLEQTGGVCHSFTGSAEDARRILGLGLLVGINGCSLKTRENITALSTLPLDKLVLETDCPWCDIRDSHSSAEYLTASGEKEEFSSVSKPAKWDPTKMVKGRNEPSNIRRVAKVVHAVMCPQKSYDEFCAEIMRNTRGVFPILNDLPKGSRTV